ncbi:MAG: hypothetical protein ACRC8W_17475, partial [Plesiomonas shigelloides]
KLSYCAQPRNVTLTLILFFLSLIASFFFCLFSSVYRLCFISSSFYVLWLFPVELFFAGNKKRQPLRLPLRIQVGERIPVIPQAIRISD